MVTANESFIRKEVGGGLHNYIVVVSYWYCVFGSHGYVEKDKRDKNKWNTLDTVAALQVVLNDIGCFV